MALLPNAGPGSELLPSQPLVRGCVATDAVHPLTLPEAFIVSDAVVLDRQSNFCYHTKYKEQVATCLLDEPGPN